MLRCLEVDVLEALEIVDAVEDVLVIIVDFGRVPEVLGDPVFPW